MRKLLEKLISIPSVPGHEDAMRDFIKAELSGVFDEMRTDALGNLICHKKGDGETRVLMTHMDCDGLVVTYSNGANVTVSLLGSIKAQHAAYRRVTLVSGHKGLLVPPQSYSSDTKISDFTLQLGEKPADEIPLGTKAYFDDSFISLEGDYVSAGTLSSRVGIACLVKAAKEAKFANRDIYFVFTVQERLGGRGAAAALYGINAKEIFSFRAVALGKSGSADKAGIGSGAAVNVMGKGFTVETELSEYIKKLCKDNIISAAFFTDANTLSDAAFAGKSGEGCGIIEICIPVDNFGSPVELLKLSDAQSAEEIAKVVVM